MRLLFFALLPSNSGKGQVTLVLKWRLKYLYDFSSRFLEAVTGRTVRYIPR